MNLDEQRAGPYTPATFTLSDAQPQRLNPQETGDRIGTSGSNCVPNTVLLVSMVNETEPAPSLADIRGGKWDYAVPYLGAWADPKGGANAYGALVSSTDQTQAAAGTVYSRELWRRKGGL